MDQRHLPKSTYLVALLISLALGIWPGVALGQQHWIFFGAFFGWVAFPMALVALLTHAPENDPVFWFQVLAACGYPLAMLGYSVCGYQAMQRTGAIGQGFRLLMAMAGVSALVSIPAAVITMSVNQGVNIPDFFPGYLSALPTHVIILVHLVISAWLGWVIARGLVLLSRRTEGRSAPGIERRS
jgi:hypothetical protein